MNGEIGPIWSAPPSCENVRMRHIGGALDLFLSGLIMKSRSDVRETNPIGSANPTPAKFLDLQFVRIDTEV